MNMPSFGVPCVSKSKFPINFATAFSRSIGQISLSALYFAKAGVLSLILKGNLSSMITFTGTPRELYRLIE